MCDASKGDGVQAGSASLADIADIPYDDLSNRKFCGSWWAAAQEDCVMDTFCGHDENSCKDFTQCYETQCHVQDLAAKELGENWKAVLMGEEDEKPAKLSQDDPRRHNFCGADWADADSKCSVWCLGEDTDCPPGLGCFGDTSCYYDDDLIPTLSPTVSPPTTNAPVTADDPINARKFACLFQSFICQMRFIFVSLVPFIYTIHVSPFMVNKNFVVRHGSQP